MPVTKKDKFAVETYSGLIAEAKARIDAVNKALAGVYKLPNPLLREFCFLQFRMVCELIALACIAAHGEVVDSGLREQWSADAIMKRLSELHPAFYPEPMLPAARAASLVPHFRLRMLNCPATSYIVNPSDPRERFPPAMVERYILWRAVVKQPSRQKLMSASPDKLVSNHELRHLYEEVLRLRELSAQLAKPARTNCPSSRAAISQSCGSIAI